MCLPDTFVTLNRRLLNPKARSIRPKVPNVLNGTEISLDSFQ